jgi:hypothetical protein
MVLTRTLGCHLARDATGAMTWILPARNLCEKIADIDMRHLLLVLLLPTSVWAAPKTVADASNALVPKALARTLRFEIRTIDAGGKFTVAAPAGWKDTGRGNLERPDEPKHDGPPHFPASMTVRGEACGGDWTGEACSDAPVEKQVDALFDGLKGDQVLAKSSAST